MLMDENMEKFSEKLKDLLALAKKKKNVLEYQEITDMFSDMDLDADKMDKIFEFLEANNIDTLRTTDEDDEAPDDDVILDNEDDIDVENIDLSVPESAIYSAPARERQFTDGMYSMK